MKQSIYYENEYKKFLENKRKKHVESGIIIDESKLNNNLFPFQKFCIKRALKAGKYALFEDCGLGKTIQQLDWANQVSKITNKPVIILAPLVVAEQTINEGLKFGIEVNKYTESIKTGVYISNYEQLDNINCDMFSGVVLDESSILKNFEGKTRNNIIEKFKNTPYKLACTGSPAPNDPMELGNHSEFLDVMSRNEMLAMFFVHDGGETGKWRIKGHAHNEFWRFVSTWAIMLTNPKDIGFPMVGYDLPELKMFENVISTKKKLNGKLFNDSAVSATDFNGELRLTKIERMDKCVDLVNKSKDQFIIWIKQNEEGELLRRLIPDAVEVTGSDTNENKTKRLLGFANGEYRILITKLKIASFGMNFQNCSNQIFASLDFSFEGLYQGIRRSYRFGQNKSVNIFIITTDTMSNVLESIKNKQELFTKMQNEMSKSSNEHLFEDEIIKYKSELKDFKSKNATLILGDSVIKIDDVPNESIGLSIFSPPFAQLYTYSDKLEDMGNSKNYQEFLFAFDILIGKLYNKIISGRNVAVHCMDLPIQKGKEGYIGLRDFSGMIIDSFSKAGFIYHSRVTIWKDPVVEMQRTKALGLLHKQVKKDATMSRVGIPDYVLIFRKDGKRLDPVNCSTIPVDLWQKYASPVWMDINYGKTLNVVEARESNDEKHICPLQLETIERLIHLYSNEGDIIFTPFLGIGSEIYQAVKMKRKGYGIELKDIYFDTAIKNIKKAEGEKKQTSLFDSIE
jgi:hypothetical protein